MHQMTIALFVPFWLITDIYAGTAAAAHFAHSMGMIMRNYRIKIGI